jgi:hypothetical protein
MRALILSSLAALSLFGLTAVAEDVYSTATIVDAGKDSSLSVSLFGGLQNTNENMLSVALDGMKITASYETMFANGKNSSANFVVGSKVQARVHKNKWLYVLREDGKPLRARIVRREMLAAE